jgi:histidine triad (HIT) family protein
MASIFTKIINKEIPCYKIAENQTHIAFLDINPVSEGHTLVVPKEEIDYIFDIPDPLLSDTILFAKKIALAIDQTLQPIRTGIILDGREVPHAHIHLIPIYRPAQSVALSAKTDVTKERMAELAEVISAGVKL